MPILTILDKYKKMQKMLDLKLASSEYENKYTSINNIMADYEKIG